VKGAESAGARISLKELTDQEIVASVDRDVAALPSQAAGFSWKDLVRLLPWEYEGPTEVVERAEEDMDETLPAQLLRILVEQNSIVMRQNELILRALNRLAPTREALSRVAIEAAK